MASTNNNTPLITQDVALLSYNSTGWSDIKINFVNILLQAHGIMLCGLQEHFQLENNLYKLDCFKDYNVFSIPARKCNNKVHRGRPSGGLSITNHYVHTQRKYEFQTEFRV